MKDLKSAEWRAKNEIDSSLSEKIISNFPLHKTEFHSWLIYKVIEPIFSAALPTQPEPALLLGDISYTTHVVPSFLSPTHRLPLDETLESWHAPKAKLIGSSSKSAHVLSSTYTLSFPNCLLSLCLPVWKDAFWRLIFETTDQFPSWFF